MATEIEPTDLRLHVYRRFADAAVTTTEDDVARQFRVSPATARTALRELHNAHLLVLDGPRVVMAHPWAADNLGFVVASDQQKWWGGCAWDSFAIPALVDRPCLVSTHCPACRTPLAIDVSPSHPPDGPLVAHLPVPVLRMWDDVVETCRNQRLFCSTGHLDGALARSGRAPGAVLDLTTLWRLATSWYAGRLTRAYRRRTPAEAAELFAGLGLVGRFWQTAEQD